MDFRLELDKHQRITSKYCAKNAYSIMALDMGLGKTPTSLHVWNRTGGNLLVIAPAYLLLNWRDEIEKCFGDQAVVTLFRAGKDIYEVFDSDIVLVSYDLAQKAEQLFEWADTILLDEGQELKSMKAKRTQFIHRVVFENSIKRLHILTGTPIKNRVEEYYSLISLCNYDPKIKGSDFLERFPDSIAFADYFSFRKEYDIEVGTRWVRIVKWEGVRENRIDELKSYLRGHYIRFTSDKVLKLAAPRTKDILLSDTPDKALLAEFERHYSIEENHGVESSLKAEAALKKAPFTVKYVKDLLEQVDFLPIYSDHVQSAEAIAQALGVPAITGKMSPSKRLKLGKAFQRGESRVLVATVKSFSTGVDLTIANNLVFNDYPWVPGDYKQTVYRIRRRNQKRRCLIHRVLGSPQDQKILHAVESKSQTIEQVI